MGKKQSVKLKKKFDIKDEDLILQLENNDDAAYKQIIAKYGQKIYCTAYRITRSHSESEDIFQEVLVSIYKNISDLNNSKALSSWIYRVTVNCSNMKMRDSKKNKDLLDRVGCTCINMTIDSSFKLENAMKPLLDAEARKVLEEAVSELPPKYKSVILLNDFNDFSLRKTSDILKISIPAVKSRLHRARKTLKRKLGLYFREIAN